MRNIRSWILAGMLLIAFCPVAMSQSLQSYPTAEIDRPLALPEMTLEPRGELDMDILGDDFGDDNWVSLRAGTGFGITDGVETGMSVPLSFAPEARAGDLQLYGLYELGPFVQDKLRTAARLSMSIPLSDSHPHWAGVGFMMLADAPVKFKFHEMIAAIGGFGMGVLTTKNDGPTYFLLNFDFGALVQPVEQLAVSFQMGIHGLIGDDSEVAIPLALRGQYTVMGNLDLFMELGFIDLNNIGGDWVQLLFGAAFRLGV